MKRALLTILVISLIMPSLLISQDTSLKEELTKTGYGLLKGANELSFVKTELVVLRKKLLNLEELNGLNCSTRRGSSI